MNPQKSTLKRKTVVTFFTFRHKDEPWDPIFNRLKREAYVVYLQDPINTFVIENYFQ